MSYLRRFASSFSVIGLIVGLGLACFSLTPSMLPRAVLVQGVLAGLVFALGYGIGGTLHEIWKYMGLKSLTGKTARFATWFFMCGLILTAIYMLGKMANWQNSIHLLMQMDEIDSGYPVTVVSVAMVTGLIIVLTFRLILYITAKVVNAIARLLPHRVAIVLGLTVVGYVLVSIATGVLLKSALHGLDDTFAAMDRVLDDQYEPPIEDLASGSTRSLIEWDDIGRNGKRFVLYGPKQAEITTLLGREAKRPIRVYAGYNTGDSLKERARIALDELKRVGGFERSLLIVAAPTGTGWLDPAAVDTVEYLHAGDIAIVGLQYSYLPSWLTLMVDPQASSRAAKALFDAVYGHWSSLAPDERPRLYLHGLSLGAFGSADTVDFLTILSDPIDGALWSGPPFPSKFWNKVTDGRHSDSPQWLPVFRDSSVIRFMNQDGFPEFGEANWGTFRVVYLQYASDPMTFFSLDLAYAEPDWLGLNRGPDVSPDLKFYPLVTFLQVAFDMMVSTGVPSGYGHNFAPNHYIDAWIEVTEPQNWSAADTKKLKEYFADFDPNPL
ncbi:alpha/beta hydrolase [Pseudomonadota bacterium]